MYGKPPSNLVRLIEDAESQTSDCAMVGCIMTGLRLGFPEIDPELVVSSRGWIGLDETLDLHVELPSLLKAQGTDQGPTRCHLTGTIRDPKIALLSGSPVVEIGQASREVGQAGGSQPGGSPVEGTIPIPDAELRTNSTNTLNGGADNGRLGPLDQAKRWVGREGAEAKPHARPTLR